nr:flagellar filament capping protein FliD [uncultured Niameybacter sp.]
MRTTSIRFTGLASGLDTESIVESMVLPYKMKVDTKWQEKTLMEMKKDAWRDMNKQLFSFYDKYIGQMRLESTFNKKSISVSNPSAITIDKNSALPIGTHTIDKISQLAQGARLESKPIEADRSTKLKDLGINVKETITLNQKEITIAENETIGSLTRKMQDAAPELNINFDDKAKAFFISSKKTGQSQAINVSGDMGVWNKIGINTNTSKVIKPATFFKIETEQKDIDGKKVDVLKEDIILNVGKESITFTAGQTMEEVTRELEEKLNPLGTPLVEPSIEAPVEKTVVKYEKGIMTLTGDNKNVITSASDNVTKTTGFTSTGKNAIVSYNGVEVESETNNISVNGLNFTINAMTSEPITLVSSQDTESMVSFMKEFVDEYNKLIEDIHSKLNATSSKGYAPLTEDQKKDMSEYEIEAWEKKIKDGIFRGDSDLKQITDTMRQILSGSVEGGAFASLSEIGITTGNWQENGKLYFDEDKFKLALAKDTDGVVQLLAGSGNPRSVYEKDQAAGKVNGTKSWDELITSDHNEDKALVANYQKRTNSIGDKLYETINEATRSTTLRSAYSFYNDKALDKKITSVKDEVSKLEDRMYRMEDMYYKKFTAMEKMMQQLNNQSNWLTSQLGGM